MNKQKDWSKHVLEQIETRAKSGLTPSQLYYKLFKIEIHDNNAKKRFTGIRNFINSLGDEKTVIKSDLNTLESFEMNKDGQHIISRLVSASEEDMKSPHRVMELLGYDPMKWELINSKYSTWNGGKSDVVLYSLKCQVKPKVTKVSTEAIERLVKKLDFSHIEIPEIECDNSGDGYLLEFPFTDIHFNKKTDDNSKIEDQKNNYLNIIQTAINKVKNKKIGLVVYSIGQDFFNSCANLRNETTAGTQQDNILSHDRMFEEGTQLLIDGIELIREQLKCKIKIIYVSGNHDMLLSYYSTFLIKKLYEHEKNVIVDCDLFQNRKYVVWGKCLIGFTHGNIEKKKLETENLMQLEMKEAWGKSMFREFHTGHFHSSKVIERGGIIYRTLNSISSNDIWHTQNGYIGSQKMNQVFLWDKNCGMVEMYQIGII